MHVCMLVTTDITNDPRVMKEATALAQAGYAVQVIGICRTGTEPVTDIFANVAMQRLDLWHLRLGRLLKARRGRPVTQGLFDNTTSQKQSPRISWRGWLINMLRQVQLLIHLLTVLWVYVFAAGRQQADVYHAHDVDTLLPALVVGWWFKRPVVYDAHEYWYNERRSEFIINAIIRWIERISTPRCAYVFAVNRSIAERMAIHYGITLPTVLMNVPADVPLQPPTPLPDDQPVQLLYHGGYLAQRGIESLITAMNLVKAPVHLTLRGYGNIELALRAQVEALGLQKKITFAPPVPMSELCKAASACHIGIIPYSKQVAEFALPNKIFEYMAAGLALICNDLIEFRNIVIGHKLGIVCNTDFVEAIAQAIDELVSDRSALEQYRQRAWQVYDDYYTWKQHQQVLLDVYSKLASSYS
ncbi:glycosyltransferase family 4 protein [Trichocoleus sp. FACHB-90]|uniref:glycosyltransferase family 4 protein n=1 Tax=Cyanophyceae TaxID=3028117 RepID=UPI0016833E87|nr:glycosyltransferase family 4 protein [Trichocoleus sp. FACHB-90]MBD1924888.1 glycosyltransferase family 4 protein [Trichocoleus sp. FACHB-90]